MGADAPAKPIIEISGLRKVYRVETEKVVALSRIDLTIHKGEVCCLLGPSGSGKSTLLNMLGGLEKPTKGTVKILGKDIGTMGESRLVKFRQRNMGFVFQSYNLLPALTALENVGLPLLFRGTRRRARKKAAMKMLDMVGLKTHAKHKPTQMSGGQQQRVGIARAFVSGAPIILADEPTGNLDSKTTAEVMSLIVSRARMNGQTLVIVTHDIRIASYADKIVHIFDGKVEAIEDGPGDGSALHAAEASEDTETAEITETVTGGLLV
ncbi:MAG: ABC transporter ATP-binding protein [Oscillospiraceae bacterium]|jgi:putative ABC transport system ATP-binding protein|nr:ABC transporter ATP-binding protein [Oscillospiraceae bacterium]